ncbi:MAG: DoxX family protein [Candidatus Woesearchaeota archaeon]
MYLNWFKKNEDYFFFVFRVIFGIVFLLHGLFKLGVLGNPAMTGLMLVVGIGEVLVGLGIIFGLFTRLAAVGGLIIMIGALVTAHFPKGLNPLANGGEPAYLFFAAFLVILALGYKKWGLDGLFKKEVF